MNVHTTPEFRASCDVPALVPTSQLQLLPDELREPLQALLCKDHGLATSGALTPELSEAMQMCSLALLSDYYAGSSMAQLASMSLGLLRTPGPHEPSSMGPHGPDSPSYGDPVSPSSSGQSTDDVGLSGLQRPAPNPGHLWGQSMACEAATSLYVKNLPPDADELLLYQKFAPYGALLSCKVLTDPATRRCRGVGFVNYLLHTSAVSAMRHLHGTRISEGRSLHVSLQAPRAMRAAAAAAGKKPRSMAAAI